MLTVHACRPHWQGLAGWQPLLYEPMEPVRRRSPPRWGLLPPAHNRPPLDRRLRQLRRHRNRRNLRHRTFHEGRTFRCARRQRRRRRTAPQPPPPVSGLRGGGGGYRSPPNASPGWRRRGDASGRGCADVWEMAVEVPPSQGGASDPPSSAAYAASAPCYATPCGRCVLLFKKA